MELDFWKARWDAGEIGFHQGAPNVLLEKYAHFLQPPSRVLVPLCGKAVDMAYLAQRGHAVVGVEAVGSACEAFFREQRVERTEQRKPPFTVHSGQGIEIWQGDMFAATPELLGSFDAAYDRAALVALAPMTRLKYVETLRRLLRPKARMLLVTLSYDQTKLPGPPWSIEPNVVRTLFQRHFVVEPLETRPTDLNGKMKAADVSELLETATLLTRL